MRKFKVITEKPLAKHNFKLGATVYRAENHPKEAVAVAMTDSLNIPEEERGHIFEDEKGVFQILLPTDIEEVGSDKRLFKVVKDGFNVTSSHFTVGTTVRIKENHPNREIVRSIMGAELFECVNTGLVQALEMKYVEEVE